MITLSTVLFGQWLCSCSDKCLGNCASGIQLICDNTQFTNRSLPARMVDGELECPCIEGAEHKYCKNVCTVIDMCERYGCKDGVCRNEGINRRSCSCQSNTTILVGDEEFRGCDDVYWCGDNETNTGEECDGGIGCGANCRCMVGWKMNMTTTNCTEVCGDAIVVGAEECDSGQGCMNTANPAMPCKCAAGFKKWVDPLQPIPIIHCQDIDECLDMNTSCVRGECLNGLGTYWCDCTETGLHLELRNTTVGFGSYFCQITNACDTIGCGSAGPDQDVECTMNGQNNRSCRCPPGFSPVGEYPDFLTNDQVFHGCKVGDPFPVWVIAIIVVGAVLLIILIVLFLLYSRSPITKLQILPSEVAWQYLQYYRSAQIGWRTDTSDGDGTAAFYSKLLEKGSEEMVRAMSLFHLLGFGQLKTHKVHAVYNPSLVSVFVGTYSVFDMRVTNPLFHSKHWENDDPLGRRKFTYNHLQDVINSCPWNTLSHPAIIPSVHGTSSKVGWAICRTGFASLSQLDAGFYGKGIYFSTSALYCYPYFGTKSDPALLVSFLLVGNPYPVIENRHDSTGSLEGMPIKSGYNCNYVVTQSNGTVYDNPQQPIFNEIVIPQESQICPVYLIELDDGGARQLRAQFQRNIPPIQQSQLPDLFISLDSYSKDESSILG